MSSLFLRLICCGAVFVLSIAALESKKPVELPAGPGKELVVRHCLSCHGLETVTAYRMTVEQWQAEMDDMIAKGAKISDPEFERIVQYLVKYFGRQDAK